MSRQVRIPEDLFAKDEDGLAELAEMREVGNFLESRVDETHLPLLPKMKWEQLQKVVRKALEETRINQSDINPRLLEVRNRFAKANTTPITEVEIRSVLQEFAEFFASRGVDVSNIGNGSRFESYVLSHFRGGEDVRDVMFGFCNYLCNVSTDEERLADLLNGFPPIEEECLPGTSGRITLLNQARFCKVENLDVVNAYVKAMARVVEEIKPKIISIGLHTHIPFFFDWRFDFKNEAQLLSEDMFYKLPEYYVSGGDVYEMRELFLSNFTIFLQQEIKEKNDRLASYCGAMFFTNDEGSSVQVVTLERDDVFSLRELELKSFAMMYDLALDYEAIGISGALRLQRACAMRLITATQQMPETLIAEIAILREREKTIEDAIIDAVKIIREEGPNISRFKLFFVERGEGDFQSFFARNGEGSADILRNFFKELRPFARDFRNGDADEIKAFQVNFLQPLLIAAIKAKDLRAVREIMQNSILGEEENFVFEMNFDDYTVADLSQFMASECSPEIVATLIDMRFITKDMVLKPDYKGEHAFHLMARKGRADLISLVTQKFAFAKEEVSTLNNDGFLPADIAVQHNKPEALKAMENFIDFVPHGADDDFKYRTIDIAFLGEREECFNYLTKLAYKKLDEGKLTLADMNANHRASWFGGGIKSIKEYARIVVAKFHEDEFVEVFNRLEQRPNSSTQIGFVRGLLRLVGFDRS